MEHRDRNQDWVLLVVGIAIVLFGASILLRTFPVFAPIQAVFDLIRRISFPLLMVALGVLLILFATRRDLFTRPDGRRLYRSRTQRAISGVLGGIAEYFGWDVALVRIIYVVVAFLTGFGPLLIAYVIASIAIPEAPPAGTVVPPQWPTADTYVPPPNVPQTPAPSQPYYPPPAPHTPPAPSAPPTAPSVPEIPAPGVPVPPGPAYPPQAVAPDVPPAPPEPPAPPVAPADEPTTPPTNA
jgi:phage shock protein PspC (stress-responsive transcriptional regulator)